MTSPAGGALPAGVSLVGGIVVDLVGVNGVRVVSEVPAMSLYYGTPAPYSSATIGTATGFTSAILNSLGTGLAKAAFRITLWDGDNAFGDPDYQKNQLSVNGIAVDNFSNIPTVQTDYTGVTLVSSNPTGGFRGGIADTGFFQVLNGIDLTNIFTSLKTTGDLQFTFDQLGNWGNVVDFTYGFSSALAPTVISGSTSSITFLQNSSPVNTPVNSNFSVTGQVITGAGSENNTVNSLDFASASTLSVSGTLTVTSGSIHSVGNSSILGGQLTGPTGLMFNAAGRQTVNSTIVGSRGVTKTGVGTVILGAANTFTGAILVSQGTLQVGNGFSGSVETASSVTVNSGAVYAYNMANNAVSALNIVNNGTVQGNSANTNTLSGVISGGGGFSQVGLGTTILTGINTYTGPTNVISGVLQIGNGVTGTIDPLSALSVQPGATLVANSPLSSLLNHSVADNGTFVLQLSSTSFSTYTFLGDISGGGNVIKAGTNTLILGGSNSYSGMTIVAGGILQVASANAIPAQSTVHVVSGAIFDLTGASTQSVGSLTGDASGTVMTGSSSVTTVGANNSNGTFAGVISGAGDVQKVGNGVWTLTGANTYTGATRLLGGAMLVNGSLQSDVFVMAGILGGGGIIHGNVSNQGMVSPGNSPGVLTIAGNYSQSSSGSLLIQLASPASYDHLVIGGTASLGGALLVDNMGNYRLRGNTYTFLTAAGGVSGTFSDISSASFLKLNVLYGVNSVALQSIYRIFGDVPGMTPNESAVAGAIDNMLDGKSFYSNKHLIQTVDYLNALPASALPAALEAIVPTDYVILPDASFAMAQTQASNLERRMEEIRSTLVDFTAETSAPSTFYTSNASTRGNGMRYIGADGRELAPAPIERCWGFFLNGSGEYVSDKCSSLDSDGKFNTGGLSMGADYRFNDHVAAGLTTGYANTTTTGRGNGSVGIDSGDLSAYATAFNQGYFVNGVLGGASSNYTVRRESLGGLTHADTTGMNFHALLGGGYSYSCEGFSGGPIASLRYSAVQIDGFSENGSLAPLDISRQSKSSMKTTLGFQAAYEIPVASAIIKPQAKMQWMHEYANDSRDIDASFQSGSAFTVNGPALGSDSLLVDLGATVMITPAVSVYGFYSGNIGASNYTSNTIFGGLQLNF